MKSADYFPTNFAHRRTEQQNYRTNDRKTNLMA